MIWVNTMAGDKTKPVKARITIEVDFMVGGESDEERKDAIREMFKDHYDDIVNESFFRDGISSMVLDSVDTEGEEDLAREVLAWAKVDDQVAERGWECSLEQQWDSLKTKMVDLATEIAKWKEAKDGGNTDDKA